MKKYIRAIEQVKKCQKIIVFFLRNTIHMLVV